MVKSYPVIHLENVSAEVHSRDLTYFHVVFFVVGLDCVSESGSDADFHTVQNFLNVRRP